MLSLTAGPPKIHFALNLCFRFINSTFHPLNFNFTMHNSSPQKALNVFKHYSNLYSLRLWTWYWKYFFFCSVTIVYTYTIINEALEFSLLRDANSLFLTSYRSLLSSLMYKPNSHQHIVPSCFYFPEARVLFKGIFQFCSPTTENKKKRGRPASFHFLQSAFCIQRSVGFNLFEC